MQIKEIDVIWHGQIDSSGRVLIPSPLRQAMGLDCGTEIVLESDGHSVRMLTLAEFTKEVQQDFRPWQPGEPLLSDELIAERRQEAARERRS